ncbi:MAG: P-II family nitrogen regulator [Lentisphaeria bacterium]|nr:P-II family nitrogen regulator [Lentisphaeria bacterium]
MKLIVAYIQPQKLNDVKKALFDKDIFKISVTNALGCGQQKGFHENYRGADIEVNLLKKVRLEIAINEEFLDATVNTVMEAARTGNIGDGKIFVIGLENCYRIRTGETGHDAIG